MLPVTGFYQRQAGYVLRMLRFQEKVSVHRFKANAGCIKEVFDSLLVDAQITTSDARRTFAVDMISVDQHLQIVGIAEPPGFKCNVYVIAHLSD